MQCSKGQGQNTTPGGQASNAQLCHLLGPQGPMLDSPHTANRDGKREPSENRTQNVLCHAQMQSHSLGQNSATGNGLGNSMHVPKKRRHGNW